MEKSQNPFIGILAGVIGSTCYNKFKSTKLPDWLAFFSGKRCVAIIAGVISIVVSAVLLFVWPLIFGGLVALGEGIVGLDAVGAGIYAFLNRLLIPVGLHHALNNVFWFDTIGLGDLSHFWAGETSADVSWSLGMYMSGFFPCMMFGVPGAALAMIQTAKSTKKKVAIGLVGSAALCAFICGVTEPFEFSIHVPCTRSVCCIRSAVRHLHRNHCFSWLPCRLLLLRRRNRPSVLCIPAGSSKYLDDHSSGHCSIRCILSGIPFRDREV